MFGGLYMPDLLHCFCVETVGVTCLPWITTHGAGAGFPVLVKDNSSPMDLFWSKRFEVTVVDLLKLLHPGYHPFSLMATKRSSVFRGHI